MIFKNNKLNSYYLYNCLSERPNSPFQNSRKEWRNWTQFLFCTKAVVNSQSQLTALKYIYIYQLLSHGHFCVTPLSIRFSRQEYWTVLPCPPTRGFLISPCYSLELCIQMIISFLFCFSLFFFSQLFVRPPQTANLLFCISLSWGWSFPCLLCNVMNLCP